MAQTLESGYWHTVDLCCADIIDGFEWVPGTDWSPTVQLTAIYMLSYGLNFLTGGAEEFGRSISLAVDVKNAAGAVRRVSEVQRGSTTVGFFETVRGGRVAVPLVAGEQLNFIAMQVGEVSGMLVDNGWLELAPSYVYIEPFCDAEPPPPSGG